MTGLIADCKEMNLKTVEKERHRIDEKFVSNIGMCICTQIIQLFTSL